MNDTTTTIILEGMPRDIWAKAKAKAYAQVPRVPIKNIVIELVTAWAAKGPKGKSGG